MLENKINMQSIKQIQQEVSSNTTNVSMMYAHLTQSTKDRFHALRNVYAFMVDATIVCWLFGVIPFVLTLLPVIIISIVAIVTYIMAKKEALNNDRVFCIDMKKRIADNIFNSFYEGLPDNEGLSLDEKEEILKRYIYPQANITKEDLDFLDRH